MTTTSSPFTLDAFKTSYVVKMKNVDSDLWATATHGSDGTIIAKRIGAGQVPTDAQVLVSDLPTSDKLC